MAFGVDNERQRLAKYYASLSDGELEQLADDADSLTASAREAFENELDRRELNDFLSRPVEQRSRLDMRALVTIRQFRDLPEALLAKGMLESSGITCSLANENLVRLDWFISNFIGGVKLQVAPEDAALAMSVLNQPVPENFEVEGVGNFEQPRCPACRSLDIAFEELNKPVAYATAYFGVPIPLSERTWKCFTCGHRWEEEPG
ncbi:MAG: DUF2007 domain-containing protein [Acidobacteriales bacterium]|nr:DUF2007 domain-containing protein [Terriglobales bacterium]